VSVSLPISLNINHMKTITTQRILVILTVIFSMNLSAQNSSENKFLFGVETGINFNQSDNINYSKKISLEGGVLAEYLFSKNFSIMGKIKYYESQVIFNYSKIIGSGMFGNRYQYLTCKYDGKIISLPITANYNFKIYRNFFGTLRTGLSLNYEISSKYEYPIEVNKDYNKFFIGITGGINLNYTTEKIIYFVGFEPIFGAKRGSTIGKDMDYTQQTQNYGMENNLFNVGMKFNLK
jgi:hypothetical protein